MAGYVSLIHTVLFLDVVQTASQQSMATMTRCLRSLEVTIMKTIKQPPEDR